MVLIIRVVSYSTMAKIYGIYNITWLVRCDTMSKHDRGYEATVTDGVTITPHETAKLMSSLLVHSCIHISTRVRKHLVDKDRFEFVV